LATASWAAKNDQSARFQQRIDFARRSILRDIYFAQVASAVTETDIQSFYDEQVARLARSEEVRLRHILLETEAAAQEVLRKVQSGADFKRVARELSRDPATNWQEGDLGFLAVEKLNESFARALLGTASGVSERIAQTEFGWHVIFVESRRKSPIPPLPEVREDIRNLLAQKKVRERVAVLRNNAKVEILDPKFSAVQPASAPTPGPAPQVPAVFTFEKTAEYAVTSPQLNLRSAPDPNSEVLAKLEIGSRGVFALGEAKDYEEERWIKVKAGGEVGWVNDRYVRPVASSNVAIDRKEGQELDGNAYRAPTVDSYNECMHSCFMDDRCRALEFDQKDKSCNLFNSVPSARPRKNVDSGIKRIISQ
jgi:hypothetical protein